MPEPINPEAPVVQCENPLHPTGPHTERHHCRYPHLVRPDGTPGTVPGETWGYAPE